jgi:hypothetical protein
VAIRKCQGTVEPPPGSNSKNGPEIDQWLASVHQPPGASYCAAFACSMVHDARLTMIPPVAKPGAPAALLFLAVGTEKTSRATLTAWSCCGRRFPEPCGFETARSRHGQRYRVTLPMRRKAYHISASARQVDRGAGDRFSMAEPIPLAT